MNDVGTVIRERARTKKKRKSDNEAQRRNGKHFLADNPMRQNQEECDFINVDIQSKQNPLDFVCACMSVVVLEQLLI